MLILAHEISALEYRFLKIQYVVIQRSSRQCNNFFPATNIDRSRLKSKLCLSQPRGLKTRGKLPNFQQEIQFWIPSRCESRCNATNCSIIFRVFRWVGFFSRRLSFELDMWNPGSQCLFGSFQWKICIWTQLKAWN